jgi:hypothetical protein
MAISARYIINRGIKQIADMSRFLFQCLIINNFLSK